MKKELHGRTESNLSATNCSSVEVHNNSTELQNKKTQALFLIIEGNADLDLVLKVKIKGDNLRKAFFTALLKWIIDSPDHGKKRSFVRTWLLAAIRKWLEKKLKK